MIPAHLAPMAEMQALYDAANGIVDLHVIRKSDRVPLLCAALDDVSTAVLLIEAIQTEDARVLNGARCTGCQRTLLRRLSAVVAAVPLGASEAVTASVCRSCDKTKHAAFLVVERLLRRLWPDAVLRRAELPREVAQ